jgi:hypothetical protein
MNGREVRECPVVVTKTSNFIGLPSILIKREIRILRYGRIVRQSNSRDGITTLKDNIMLSGTEMGCCKKNAAERY